MIREKVLEIVCEASDLESSEVIGRDDLFSGGVLDSFSVMMITGGFEKEFGITLEIDPNILQHLNSIDSMENLINELRTQNEK